MWEKIALILTIVGGLNWGLVGAFNFNLVEFIFGFAPILASIVYVVVGLSAIYAFYAYLIK
jgi:uncharacterized membrane protein YuzA (DUF378 family)